MTWIRRHSSSSTNGLVVLAVALAFALGLGVAALGPSHFMLAVGACLLPLVPLLVLHSQAAVIGAMAFLPFEFNVVGGVVGGLKISTSDMLLATALAGLLLGFAANGQARQRLTVLRPMLPLLGVYAGASIVVMMANPSLQSVVNLIQRFEVVALPLLIGALLLTVRSARCGLVLFVGATLVMSLAWMLTAHGSGTVLGMQKNPSGQYISDAALIVMAVFVGKRFRFLLLPILVFAVYASESRGALIGLIGGLIMFALLRARGPFQFVIRVLPVASLLLIIYTVLPQSSQARLGGDSSTAFSDKVRATYITNAWQIIHAHPVLGVGIGNYLSGESSNMTLTNDPHSILLLEAAEGGAVLAIAFLVLQLGALVVVFRRRRRSPWAIPAICVQAAILVHAQLDVYWVRGTPVIGWLLIGLALAPLPVPTVSRASATGLGSAPEIDRLAEELMG